MRSASVSSKGTSVAEIRVGYFLEDIGHQRFICTLVERVAQDLGLPPAHLRHDVRNASGGAGQTITSLRSFLHRHTRTEELPFDVLVVAIDGNCSTYAAKRDEIVGLMSQAEYPGLFACAVPNPHVERWYIADPMGFRNAFATATPPSVPRYKCEKARYKTALSDALRDADLEAPLGGAEYGEEIAQHISLQRAGANDPSLKHFRDDVRQALAAAARAAGLI
jgi:hypothetical protein